MNVSAVRSGSATHVVTASIKEVARRYDIYLTVNGQGVSNFSFNAGSGALSASLNLKPGQHRIALVANNDCGEDRATQTVRVEAPPSAPPAVPPTVPPTAPPTAPPAAPPPADPGGGDAGADAGWVRINPGNADWQFCLVTGRGTYTRADLKSSAFSYSGSASSLYFKPIAGGGTALVNGKPFTLNSGQYYLFSGSLQVKVTNSRKGAMGQWSVYVKSGSAPRTGKGNRQPQSPCSSDSKKGGRNE
jgi:hypothetical protein